MAKTVVKNFTLTIGGTDYAAQVKGRDLAVAFEEHDVTNADSGTDREFIAGLSSYDLTIQLVKDADLSGLDAAMWTARGTSVAWVSKFADTTIGVTNPQYSGNGIVMGWTPFSGEVGSLFAGELKLKGTGAITRATA